MAFKLEQREPSQEATVPGQMSAPSLLVTGQNSIRVTLAGDPDDGGSLITDYDIRWQPSGGSWTTVSSIQSPYDLTALSPGTTYEIQSRAVNAVGDGAWSSTSSATTLSTPSSVLVESVSFEDDSDSWGVVNNTPNQGSWVWGRVADGGGPLTADGSGGWNEATQAEGTISVGAPLEPFTIPATGEVDGITYDMYLYQRVGTDDSAVITVKYVADNTAPVITAISTGWNGEVGVDVNTDTGEGVAYSVATSSATPPTVAQIIAGQDHTGADALSSKSKAVSGTGAQGDMYLTGLTNAVLVHTHTVHLDNHRNESNIISSTATPSTSVGPQARFISSTIQGNGDGTVPIDMRDDDLVAGDTVILAVYNESNSPIVSAISLEGTAGVNEYESVRSSSRGYCQYYSVVVPAAAVNNPAAEVVLTRDSSNTVINIGVWRIGGSVTTYTGAYVQETDGTANFNITTGNGCVIAAGNAYLDATPEWTVGAIQRGVTTGDVNGTAFGDASTSTVESRAMELTGITGVHGSAVALT